MQHKHQQPLSYAHKMYNMTLTGAYSTARKTKKLVNVRFKSKGRPDRLMQLSRTGVL